MTRADRPSAKSTFYEADEPKVSNTSRVFTYLRSGDVQFTQLTFELSIAFQFHQLLEENRR